MKNPFASEVPAVSPEEESAAAGLFSPICDVTLSDDGVARIRGTMANALSATLAARPSTSTMRRVAVASAAVTAPLMAVSAVGALTGSEPLAGPLDFVSNAVGLSSAETPAASGETPTASPSTSATSSATASASPSASTTPGAGSAAGQSGGAAAAAHTNNKGCDDVNPAVQGTPTPGGPVDCKVGNSADHRQNGKEHGKPTSTATATGDPSASPTTTGDDEDEDEDTADDKGGVSRGLGLGHEKGKGLGHEKHGHEPNENGKGPSKTVTAGPSASPAAAGTPVPGGSTATSGATGSDSSGGGHGKSGSGGSGKGGKK